MIYFLLYILLLIVAFGIVYIQENYKKNKRGLCIIFAFGTLCLFFSANVEQMDFLKDFLFLKMFGESIFTATSVLYVHELMETEEIFEKKCKLYATAIIFSLLVLVFAQKCPIEPNLLNTFFVSISASLAIDFFYAICNRKNNIRGKYR